MGRWRASTTLINVSDGARARFDTSAVDRQAFTTARKGLELRRHAAVVSHEAAATWPKHRVVP